MSRVDHQEAAAALAAAWSSGVAIEPLTERWPEMDVADAYRIQGLFLEARGVSSAVGWKVGLTSQAMRDQLGIDQPDFGRLFFEMAVPDGGVCSLDDLIAPRVEAELAFVMAKPLEGPVAHRDQAMAAVEAIVPALEIIDSRIVDWRIKLEDTVADHASSARFVVGPQRVAPGSEDLAQTELVFEQDGIVQSTGRGEAVLGHPAEALVWLANALAPFGEGLAAGEVVLAGAFTQSIPALRGSTVAARFSGGLGSVSVSFARTEHGAT